MGDQPRPIPRVLACYEACVQSPRHVVSLLRGAYRARTGGEATTLLEDFCGTAAVSARWIEEGEREGLVMRAVASDLDEDALREARAHPRLDLHRRDCLESSHTEDVAGEVIWVGNFSIGYAHTRAVLMRYLSSCKARLDRGGGGFGGGLLACDTYGGVGAFALGSIERTHTTRGGDQVRYVWTHEAADPRNGMVRNSISMRVLRDGAVVAEYPRCFVYEWRLWSLAELREAMLDAGFVNVRVYKEVLVPPGGVPRAIDTPEELGEDYAVVVIAEA